MAGTSDGTDSNEATTRGLTDREVRALHEAQLGKEKLHKAHGHLLDFHHRIGRAMQHFDEAASLLSEKDAADELLAVLDRGVVPGRWSWWLVDTFEEHFLDEVLAAEEELREAVAGDDAPRHLHERRWEREARQRAAWTRGDDDE